MKNTIKKIIILGIAVGMSTALMAEPNIDNSGMHAKMAKMAGEKGMFVKHEAFPKDYFLISKSLPFAVGLTLHHPRSSELNLSETQIEQIKKIKRTTVPAVVKAAKEIKALEIALAKRMMDGAKAEDESKAVDTIAAKKNALTKVHLVCIQNVRTILTPEQRKILLSYASVKMHKDGHKKGKDTHKEGKGEHKAGLVKLPHLMKALLPNLEEFKIDKAQNIKINEIMAEVPSKMHEMMDKAAALEKSIRKAVVKEKKSLSSVSSDLDKLEKIKRDITTLQIKTITRLQKILTDEQYKLLVLELKASHQCN